MLLAVLRPASPQPAVFARGAEPPGPPRAGLGLFCHLRWDDPPDPHAPGAGVGFATCGGDDPPEPPERSSALANPDPRVRFTWTAVARRARPPAGLGRGGFVFSCGRVRGVAVNVEVLNEVTEETVKAFARLLPQLSRSAPPLDKAGIARVAGSGPSTVLVARSESGEIVGTLTLVVFPIPTGLRAWIEDVVVDEAARGQGAGAALTQEALRLAREMGARTVDLTSRPSREAAGRLYERLGFQRRDSRLYRFTLDG